MSSLVKLFSDQEVEKTPMLRQILENMRFELGESTLRERLKAIQEWVGGPDEMARMTTMSISGSKAGLARRDQSQEC